VSESHLDKVRDLIGLTRGLCISEGFSNCGFYVNIFSSSDLLFLLVHPFLAGFRVLSVVETGSPQHGIR
jgi:hypothetical protein